MNGAVNNRDALSIVALRHSHQKLARSQSGHFLLRAQLHATQPAAGKDGIGCYHLSAGGAGWIHPLIVEHDLHVPSRRLIDRQSHETQKAVRHPAGVAGQANPGMNHKSINAVKLEIGDLAQ